ncbi:flagellar hook-basal body complex protein [Halovulum sp. GXIMD14793]
MDTSGYVALSRQTGLMREMQAVANNIANISTTGFRREGVVFAEVVRALDAEGGAVALTAPRARFTDEAQGSLARTGGRFDFAIEGDGFFMVETPAGTRLTRSGAFMPNAEGELVNALGHRLLDAGESPIFVPPDARSVAVGPDGTMTADGQPVAQIGAVMPEDMLQLFREDGVNFRNESGLIPVEDAQIVQGYLEESNVNPVGEITRMIEVQRSYELGQKLLEREDERIRAVTRTLGQHR